MKEGDQVTGELRGGRVFIGKTVCHGSLGIK